MNLAKILKTAGTAILKSVVPGGGLIIDLVNGFLPGDKKLSSTATGADVQAVIDALPPEQRTALLSKELDVEIVEAQEWTKTMGVLAEADKVGASTRPSIAKMMAYVVSFSVLFFSTSLSVAILTGDSEIVKQLEGTWPLALAILATPTALLHSYFALRSKEKKSRYEMAGAPESVGVIGNIISAFKDK